MVERPHLITSWDDGARTDLRLAEMLDSIGLQATFYISRATTDLTADEIRYLSDRHEIGSHTLNHSRWGTVDNRRWISDVIDGRNWLEDLLGRSVKGFAYPGGMFDDLAARLVSSEVGHARTTLLGALPARASGIDMHRIHTTIHARTFPVRHRIGGLRYRWASRRWWSVLDWRYQAGVLGHTSNSVHLWGHSWEVELQGSWDPLRRALTELGASRDGVGVTKSLQRMA
jgi:peptidoglycan/xylan/chitin deacetylase (PgdA/CDA1 family)